MISPIDPSISGVTIAGVRFLGLALEALGFFFFPSSFASTSASVADRFLALLALGFFSTGFRRF